MSINYDQISFMHDELDDLFTKDNDGTDVAGVDASPACAGPETGVSSGHLATWQYSFEMIIRNGRPDTLM